MKFGPSGNSDAFYEAGYKSSQSAPVWLAELGLTAYEYPFSKGVRIGENLAKEIGIIAQKNEIAISAHAPYYTNFASEDREKIIRSYEFIIQSIKALKWFEGKRVIMHPGSPLKLLRADAYANMLNSFSEFADIIYEKGLQDTIICPETMGKVNQMGSLDEIINVCKLSPNYIPCIDFGHLNSREKGSLKSSDDYRRVLDKIFDGLGEAKGRAIHIHFSHIQYGDKGEIRHLTFEDNEFGPFFEHLAPVLVEYKVNGWIISESRGTQAMDACTMKDIYNSFT